MRAILGSFINWLGWPGFVQETEYRAKIADIYVCVRKSPLFTTVTVNGVDVYFERVTGRIDGVGISQTAGCRWGLKPRSTRLVEQPEPTPGPAQTESR